MKILMTGASGLLGRAVKNALRTNQVIDIKEWFMETHSYSLDFRQNWDENLLPKKIECIIHLAQSPHYREFPQKSQDIFQTNTLSTLKLLNYALNNDVKHFIYASTGGVYKPARNALHEDSHLLELNDLSFYFASKLSSEMLCHSYSQLLKMTILRPFFIYGPNQSREMLIPRLINNVKHGMPINISGENGPLINPIYVDDAADIITGIVQKRISGVFNLSGNEIISIRQIAEKIGKLASSDISFQLLPSKSNLISDNTSLMRFFENFVWTKFDIGLKRTWDTFK